MSYSSELDKYVGGCSHCWPVRGGVAITFDDGLLSTYTLGFSVMSARGIPGTIYCITSRIGDSGFATAANLTTMRAAGWTIGNHSATHPNFVTDGLTQEQIEAELTTAYTTLNGLGFGDDGKYVAYPFGAHGAAADAAMAATGMLTGRDVDTGTFDLSLFASGPYNVNSDVIDATTTLAAAKTFVDGAKTTGRFRTILLHGLVEGAPADYQWGIDDFTALMDYVLTAGVGTYSIAGLYRTAMRI